jgi:hypothetical protein
MAKKIESLTPEQIAKFPDYVREWTDIGLSTQPADRPAAEEAIRLMYAAAGLNHPQIVWTGSPMGNAITRAVVKQMPVQRIVVGASVRDSVWDSVWASVGDSVGASDWTSVGTSVRAIVRASVWASVRDSVGDSVWASVYGQHDANWLAFYMFFHDECGLMQETEKLRGLWQLCRTAGWAIPHENICWVSERHNVLNRDEQGRLHCTTGPALAYPDGWSIYAWHGVRVPENIIMQPETITAADIAGEPNAEIRRVMLEMFGRERFVDLPECIKVHTDDWGSLYRNDAIRDINDDPYCFVKVLNSTPEPDGTYKDYILRVNPNIQTAYEAVASTFPRIPAFAPAVES